MNINKIKELVNKELSEFEVVVEFEENCFNLDVSGENVSEEYNEEDVIDKVEYVLYKISEMIEDEDMKERFIDEISSDIWFSGFRLGNNNGIFVRSWINFECDFN